MPESYPIISADSHICEPPNTYVDFIDARWKDVAPQMRYVEGLGDAYFADGLDNPVPMGLVAAAGKPPEEIRIKGVRFDEMHKGGWDADARMAEQDRDGVAAEIIYPTVGMVLCNHPDFDYKKACFAAYNRWLQSYCEKHPHRLLGAGQVSMRSVRDGIEELEEIAALGLRGVMMPGDPAEEDYDSLIYDPFWEKAVELGLPISFHILTDRNYAFEAKPRGPRLNGFLNIMRGCQDIMGTLVFGGVFDRNPQLRVVCVEADAGWVPHYMYRMDHGYKRHRHWIQPGRELQKLPSEYFAEHIYATFQDDWVAFEIAHLMNWRRLMWANDFPHSDSTWPWSQKMLEEHTRNLTAEQKRAILCGNVAELYGIDLAALQ